MIHKGTVVTFQERKRWGFIEESDGSRWFFHTDNADKGFHPRLGIAVEFLIGPPLSLGKPDQAVDVHEADLGVENGICAARIGNDVCQLQNGQANKHKDGVTVWTDADAALYGKKVEGSEVQS
jgi:cold shock CspA family protein